MNLLVTSMLAVQVQLGKRFAESCPYFDFSDCGESEKEARHKKIDDWIQCRMPELCSTETFRLFKFCVATFIFHRDWLDENIHEDTASDFLHSGLNQFLLQAVLSQGFLGTRLKTPSQQMFST